MILGFRHVYAFSYKKLDYTFCLKGSENEKITKAETLLDVILFFI